MKIVRTPQEAREIVKCVENSPEHVPGLVPTMGFLHEGHLSLIRRCRRECTFCAVSIFVNPLQFGPAEDFYEYPRDMGKDVALLEQEGVDLLFAPSTEDMYHPESSTIVSERKLSGVLCGASRPGHFDGVCTVVLKLYNILRPRRMYFGEKDYQQLAVVRRMMRDLNVSVEVIGCPIIRDPDGLAKSSRNVYLQALERKEALCINQALSEAESLFLRGERKTAALEEAVRSRLSKTGLVNLEYVEVRDADNLERTEEIENPVVVAVAARVGKARLIDNRVLRL